MQNKILELGHLAQYQVQIQAFDAAEGTLKQILAINSQECNALQLYGFVLASQGRAKECIKVLKAARALKPQDYSILMNLGKALFDESEYEQCIEVYKSVLDYFGPNPDVLMDIGNAYSHLRQFDFALQYYDQALEINPSSSEALNNKSIVLLGLAKYKEAIDFSNQAIAVHSENYLAWTNLGNIYFELREFEKCLQAHEKSVSLNPSFAEAWTNIGNVLLILDRLDESLQAHEIGLQIDSSSAEAWAGKGATLNAMKRLGEALAAYQEAYKLDEELAIGMISLLKMHTCEWNNLADIQLKLLGSINGGAALAQPFSLLPIDSRRATQMKCAQIYCEKFNKNFLSYQFPKITTPQRKLRIGYFSSDFGNHPVGQLIENVLKFHDKECFELVGFYLKNHADHGVAKSIEALFDERFHITEINTDIAVETVRKARIDIAVDLNGHTANSREDIIGCQLAPVQVAYLGYPGATGLQSIDYMVADKITIPAEHQDDYMGKIVSLPSFFPTSRPNISFDNVPSRAEAGLPENGFVYCCFNSTFKITPDVFDIWMRLLLKTPGSILWLSSPSKECITNLQTEAHSRGVDASRLIFASRVEKIEDHLLRLSLADLFLDTFYYNAHTTALDALSAGVPVLTKQGDTFAGRVASSLLHAIEVTELVSHSSDEYEAQALELAHNPNTLNRLKEKIKLNRVATNFFNMGLYVKSLEDFYRIAYDRYINDLPPEHLNVS